MYSSIDESISYIDLRTNKFFKQVIAIKEFFQFESVRREYLEQVTIQHSFIRDSFRITSQKEVYKEFYLRSLEELYEKLCSI